MLLSFDVGSRTGRFVDRDSLHGEELPIIAWANRGSPAPSGTHALDNHVRLTGRLTTRPTTATLARPSCAGRGNPPPRVRQAVEHRPTARPTRADAQLC